MSPPSCSIASTTSGLRRTCRWPARSRSPRTRRRSPRPGPGARPRRRGRRCPSPTGPAGRACARPQALLDAGAGREEATGPLRAAAEAARSIGAHGLLREVEALAARARIDVDAPEESPGAGLTPREAEVLVHLAAGRTNRQIAEALYISPRTAGVHVSRILAKLGATTRGEAAAAGRLAGVIDEERVEALLTRSTG